MSGEERGGAADPCAQAAAVSSRPEIAPGASAAAATGPGCHSARPEPPAPGCARPSAAPRLERPLGQLSLPTAGWRGRRREIGAGPQGGGPEGAGRRGWLPRPHTRRAVLLPLQGLGRGGGGSWAPAPPDPSRPFRRPHAVGRQPSPARSSSPSTLVLPGSAPSVASTRSSLLLAGRPAPPPQPWTPSRRRCRC